MILHSFGASCVSFSQAAIIRKSYRAQASVFFPFFLFLPKGGKETRIAAVHQMFCDLNCSGLQACAFISVECVLAEIQIQPGAQMTYMR